MKYINIYLLTMGIVLPVTLTTQMQLLPALLFAFCVAVVVISSQE